MSAASHDADIAHCKLMIRDGSLCRVSVGSDSLANTPEGSDNEQQLSEEAKAQMLVAHDEMARWQNVRMVLHPVRLSANDVLAGQKHLPADSERTQCACMHPDETTASYQHLLKYRGDQGCDEVAVQVEECFGFAKATPARRQVDRYS